MLNDLELTGRTRTHVVQRDDLHAALLPGVIEPFLDMKADAARDGVDIAIASAFRDFRAQQRIWDMKFRGERPLYDAEGAVRDHAALSQYGLIEAILTWSALPGASRHHWGTELDLIDAAAMPEGYRVRLVTAECTPGGVFHPLHCWLDARMSQYGFFRPYRTMRGGVVPEPWHVSYAPVSVPALRAFSRELLAEAIRASDMMGKDLVVERLDALYARYVTNVDPPPADGVLDAGGAGASPPA